MKENKPLSLGDLIFLKLTIGISVILLAACLAKGTDNTVAIGWYYSAAITFVILYWGHLVFRFEPMIVYNLTKGMVVMACCMLMIFGISLTGVFDGPYGSVCQIPMLLSSITILAAGIFGYLCAEVEEYSGDGIDDKILINDINRYFSKRKKRIINSSIGIALNVITIFLFTFLQPVWEIRAIFFLIFIDYMVIGGWVVAFGENTFSVATANDFIHFSRYLAGLLFLVSAIGIWSHVGNWLDGFLSWPGIIASLLILLASLIKRSFFSFESHPFGP